MDIALAILALVVGVIALALALRSHSGVLRAREQARSAADEAARARTALAELERRLDRDATEAGRRLDDLERWGRDAEERLATSAGRLADAERTLAELREAAAPPPPLPIVARPRGTDDLRAYLRSGREAEDEPAPEPAD